MSWHVSALCEARRQFGHRWYPLLKTFFGGLVRKCRTIGSQS